PKAMQGLPIAFFASALVTMAFWRFSGLRF
ncbi:electron transport complex subunit RsxA, partial [bacterium]